MKDDMAFGVAIPRLASLDIPRSLAFMAEKLGFTTVYLAEHNYGISQRGKAEIHFWACRDPKIARNTSCYVRVEDIAALHAELKPRLPELLPVEHRPWGMAELHVFDPDGNLLTFGEEVA